jgi:hypothetical protein
MRQRSHQRRLALANPRVPLAPDATSHHRAVAVSPASRRPQCEQLSACTPPVLYAIEKSACVTVISACCSNHRPMSEPCPRNRRNCKASRLETIVQSDSGSFICGTSQLLSHQLGCQSQSFAHTCISCKQYYLVSVVGVWPGSKYGIRPRSLFPSAIEVGQQPLAGAMPAMFC